MSEFLRDDLGNKVERLDCQRANYLELLVPGDDGEPEVNLVLQDMGPDDPSHEDCPLAKLGTLTVKDFEPCLDCSYGEAETAPPADDE